MLVMMPDIQNPDINTTVVNWNRELTLVLLQNTHFDSSTGEMTFFIPKLERRARELGYDGDLAIVPHCMKAYLIYHNQLLREDSSARYFSKLLAMYVIRYTYEYENEVLLNAL